jgi:hypothetical protein
VNARLLHQAPDRYDFREQNELRRTMELQLDEIRREAKRKRFSIALLAPDAATLTVTNAPAAVTEVNGVARYRTIVNLYDVEFAELFSIVLVAGAAGSTLRVQYTTDLTGSAGWTALDGGTEPSVSSAATGPVQSSKIKIETAARRWVLLRPVTAGGDAAADPGFGLTRIEFS